MTYANKDLLVEPDWLWEHLGDQDLVIVDCPWDIYSYGRAHVPGAVMRPGHSYVKGVDEKGDMTLHLPDPAQFRELLSKLGIGRNSKVVLYDEWGSLFAARLWWVLRYYGHDGGVLLNGGWQGWVSAGLPVSIDVPESPDGETDFTPTPRPERLVTVEELKSSHDSADWQIVDARSDDEYEGREGEGNKRLGHIPGAAHFEWNRLLENSEDATAIRRFRSSDEVRPALDSLGLSDDKTKVTHCQAAVRGSLLAFGLELHGYSAARLYDGSMEEWGNRDDTPLE